MSGCVVVSGLVVNRVVTFIGFVVCAVAGLVGETGVVFMGPAGEGVFTSGT